MMKRKLFVLLVLAALAFTVAAPVTVQAYAKKSEKKNKHKKKDAESSAPEAGAQHVSKKEARKQRKEQKRQEKNERKKQKQERRAAKRLKNAKAEGQAAEEKDETATKPEHSYPTTEMKGRYRIDVLAALYLDDLVKGNTVSYKTKMPERAEQGIAFYEGVQIAADSLKKAGFKIDIYIHDVTSAKESAGMLIAQGSLDSSDLIIGDVPANDIVVVAAYARKMQINFVSASPLMEGGVTGNPYFSLLQPSLRAHCEWIAGNIAVKYPDTRACLLYSTAEPEDEDAYKYLTKGKSNQFRQLSVKTMPTKEILGVLLDTTRPNVLVMPLMNIGYADSILRTLSGYFPSTHFDVYGMPTWSAISRLRTPNAWPNITVYLTSPFYLNATSNAAKYVSRTYKRDYGGRAPEAAYRGYEAMFWYAHLLKDYGTIFNMHYENNTAAPFSSYDVHPRTDKKGNIQYYENKHVFLTKYDGGTNKTE